MDGDTNLAIVTRAAEAEGVTLSTDVALYVARLRLSRSDTEGLVLRLLAYASLTGRPITLSLAQYVIGAATSPHDLNNWTLC